MQKRIKQLLEFTYQKTFESENRFPMAAVLVKRNRIVSIGVNRIKTHPKQKLRVNRYGESYGWHKIHAELDCLIRSKIDVSGSTIFVVRRSFIGVGMAKPCINCEEILREYGVKKVLFSIPKDLESYGVMKL